MSGFTRKKDAGEAGHAGEFGSVVRRDADIEVARRPGERGAVDAALVVRFGFDVGRADPVDFDEYAAEADKLLAKTRFRLRSRLDELHRAVGDRRQGRGRPSPRAGRGTGGAVSYPWRLEPSVAGRQRERPRALEQRLLDLPSHHPVRLADGLFRCRGGRDRERCTQEPVHPSRPATQGPREAGHGNRCHD